MKSILLAFSSCLSCLGFASRSEAQSTPTWLDSASLALVAAINSTSPLDRSGFIERRLATTVSPDERDRAAALLEDLHDESGGLDILRVEPIGRGRFITVRAMKYPRLALLNIAPAGDLPGKLAVIELLKSWNPKSDSIAWPTQRSFR